MAKIKKNLSDEEMFKGFKEELNFENTVYEEEKIKLVSNKEEHSKKDILLSGEALERLNRFLLEVSMEWLKNKKGSCAWKVLKENGVVTIKPVPFDGKR